METRDKKTLAHIQGKQEVMGMATGGEMVFLLCLSKLGRRAGLFWACRICFRIKIATHLLYLSC